MNRKIRLTLDVTMLVAAPVLMAFAALGETFHEIVGTAATVVFVAHCVANRRWYNSFFKGAYNATRVFQTILDAALFTFLILQPISGILMSRHIFAFLPDLPLTAKAREIHMLCAYWGYVLLSLHVGTHLAPLAAKLDRKKTLKTIIRALVAAISIYGVYAFVRRGFPGYMARTTKFAFFDYDEPKTRFFADYLSVMILFMMIGRAATRKYNLLHRKRKRS